MNKRSKIIISILLCLFSLLLMNGKLINAAEENTNNNTNLVLDNRKYEVIPNNFRKTSDLSKVNNKKFNLTGLENLNISGSQQFSPINLPMIVEEINTKLPIKVIDLRQESHGFVNQYPISYKNEKNDANRGKSKSEVLEDESKRLGSIKLNEPITFYNHPKMNVIPTKVQDENELSTSNSLGYIRVPVTDGTIPTDDMVDYFVESIKSEGKDNWLHFHCKEGIGRTTTFMIMYDMMNNAKNVPKDDIIERQIKLANFKPSTVDSFKNEERMNFLDKFYNYSKNNNDDFKTKWTEYTKTITTSSNSFLFKDEKNSVYFKNPHVPKNLYVISEDKMNSSERTMIASLQGLVNSKSTLQIYTLNKNQPDYKIWLEDLNKNYGVNYEIIEDPWDLLNKFKNYVEGYVIYSNKNSMDPSINNACTMASLNNSIVINEDIEEKVKNAGINNIICDCRNTDKNWAFDNLWNFGLNHKIVIELSPERDSPLRDYALMAKALVFYEDDKNDSSLREKIFKSLKENSVCLGWGPDEYNNVSLASKYGVSVIAADWSQNLSVLSAFPSEKMEQKNESKSITNENAHYITFIMSDGDNQQWELGTEFTSPKWYGSKVRGEFNLGWGISPSLYYLAPTVYKMYYENASKLDYFLVPPSGMGYIYPSKFPKEKMEEYTKELNSYMEKVDEKYSLIIDDGSFHDTGLWDNYTKCSNIDGLLYLDFHRHDDYHGEIVWSNNKPIVSCRDLLWEGLESEEDLINNINNRVVEGQTDIHDPKSYTFVYVHVWSKNLDDALKVVDNLKENPKVKIVNPNTFMQLIRENISH